MPSNRCSWSSPTPAGSWRSSTLTTRRSVECWKLPTKSTSPKRLHVTIRDPEAPLVEDWDTSAPLPSSLTYLRFHRGYSRDYLIFGCLFEAAIFSLSVHPARAPRFLHFHTLPGGESPTPRLSNLRLLLVNANDYDSAREPEADHYQQLSLALAACNTPTARFWMHPRNPHESSFFPSLPRSITDLEVQGLYAETKQALAEACEKKGIKLTTQRG